MYKKTNKEICNEFDMLNILQSDVHKKTQNFQQRTFYYPTATKYNTYKKNMYPNILPNENTLVRLSQGYINANWVLNKNYIATQTPMLTSEANTVGDFWRMVLEKNVYVIVNLSKPGEKRQNGQPKSYQYWSTKPLRFNNLTVKMVKEVKREDNIMIRIIKLTNQNIERIVTLLHYIEWLDFSTPNIKDMNSLIKLVDHYRIDHTPITIHCSAGVGRTGTFIAIHYLNKNKNQKQNIMKLVNIIRNGRNFSVQTLKQYKFIYEFYYNLIQK